MHKSLFFAFQYLVTPSRPVDWLWKPAVLCMLSTAVSLLMFNAVGVMVPMKLPAFYVFISAISLPFFLLGMKIAEENKQLQEKLASLALTDLLTGLDNRRAFFKKTSGLNGSILMMDVDRFKRVNDTFGHNTGDAILQDVARHLEACIRPGDHVARFGGEEFAVFLLNADEKQAREIGDRITKGVTRAPVGVVTLSVGAVGPKNWQGDVAEAFRRADKALYAAKHRGRACVVIWPVESMAA